MPSVMAKFKVGDHVQKTGLVPIYLKDGIVKEIIPHADLQDGDTEYKVDFKFVVLRFYESELQPANVGEDNASLSY
jgi:hypothetical protein